MPYVTILFAAILIFLGGFGYLQSGGSDPADSQAGAADTAANDETAAAANGEAEKQGKGGKSITALIPAAFGLLLLIFGTLALKAEWLKHAMHGAATVALLAVILGGARVAMKLGSWMSGDMTESQNRAFQMVALMSITCLIFIGFCVNSFIAARRAKTAAAAASESGTA